MSHVPQDPILDHALVLVARVGEEEQQLLGELPNWIGDVTRLLTDGRHEDALEFVGQIVSLEIEAERPAAEREAMAGLFRDLCHLVWGPYDPQTGPPWAAKLLQ